MEKKFIQVAKTTKNSDLKKMLEEGRLYYLDEQAERSDNVNTCNVNSDNVYTGNEHHEFALKKYMVHPEHAEYTQKWLHANMDQFNHSDAKHRLLYLKALVENRVFTTLKIPHKKFCEEFGDIPSGTYSIYMRVCANIGCELKHPNACRNCEDRQSTYEDEDIENAFLTYHPNEIS